MGYMRVIVVKDIAITVNTDDFSAPRTKAAWISAGFFT